MTASLKKDQTLVSALAEERRRQGLTQEVLAVRMKTKQPFLARMEQRLRLEIKKLRDLEQQVKQNKLADELRSKKQGHLAQALKESEE